MSRSRWSLRACAQVVEADRSGALRHPATTLQQQAGEACSASAHSRVLSAGVASGLSGARASMSAAVNGDLNGESAMKLAGISGRGRLPVRRGALPAQGGAARRLRLPLQGLPALLRARRIRCRWSCEGDGCRARSRRARRLRQGRRQRPYGAHAWAARIAAPSSGTSRWRRRHLLDPEAGYARRHELGAAGGQYLDRPRAALGRRSIPTCPNFPGQPPIAAAAVRCVCRRGRQGLERRGHLEGRMSNADDIKLIVEQEKALVFPQFDEDMAFKLGSRPPRAGAGRRTIGIAIEIRTWDRPLFYAALRRHARPTTRTGCAARPTSCSGCTRRAIASCSSTTGRTISSGRAGVSTMRTTCLPAAAFRSGSRARG